MNTPVSIPESSVAEQPYGVLNPEAISRFPVRPMGTLSDYATLSMPADIAAVRKGDVSLQDFAKHLDGFCSEPESVDALSEEDLPLALYDVTALASALRVLQSENPAVTNAATPKLNKLMQKMARRRGLVPHLSYEGLIFANPIDTDPRTFLNGDLGRQELLFYKLHVLIEQEFKAIFPEVLHLVKLRHNSGKRLDGDLVLQGLDALHGLLTRISDLMSQFHHHISKKDGGVFQTARPFWNGTDKYQGPSGKFSAGYFVLDSLIAGSDSSIQNFLKTKLHELAHYPNTELAVDGFCGQDDMLAAFADAKRGHDLKTMAQESDDAAVILRSQELLSSAERNRSMHIGLASGFLPVAFRNGESGTGEQAISMREYLNIPRAAYAAIVSNPQ